MVRRVFVEKRPGLNPEAAGLLADLRDFLGIHTLLGVRVLRRYDVENLEDDAFEKAKGTVFSEPQVDVLYEEDFPVPASAGAMLAVEALPGQFDQRADSAAQCIQLMTGGERPAVAAATLYLLQGALEEAELEKIKGYLINPVECREASLEKPETLARAHAAPPMVETLAGFRELSGQGLEELLASLGLAMDLGDLRCCQS